MNKKDREYIRKSKNSVQYLAWQFGVSEEEIREVLKPKAPVKEKKVEPEKEETEKK